MKCLAVAHLTAKMASSVSTKSLAQERRSVRRGAANSPASPRHIACRNSAIN
ncbi:hypothetical protein NA78x_003349 [Anatilimnocola sp. NA78]|uniref:hypothetical protein n=1 Tax=Anatilimnocola sp. NA78 TaxID=3415683 RepID=UPI003CE5A37E